MKYYFKKKRKKEKVKRISSKHYLNVGSTFQAKKDLVAARYIIESWSVVHGPGQQGWWAKENIDSFAFYHLSL